MNKQQLIDKYEKLLRTVINPDGYTSWADIGWNESPEGYNSVTDWLEKNGEFDEGQQTEIRLYYDMLDDLRKLEV